MGSIAMSVTKSRQRNRTYVAPRRNEVLHAIYERNQATAKEAGSSPAYMLVLEQQKLVRRVKEEHTGRVGRPPIVWALTDKARKRVKRAIS